MTILLVEDSRFLRITGERALARLGHRVIGAGDGNEALRIARENLPDLILLDMMLPKITGLEVLEILKRELGTMHIPVIVLSGLSQQNEAKLLQSGATAYFKKSENMWEHGVSGLFALIEQVVVESKRPQGA